MTGASEKKTPCNCAQYRTLSLSGTGLVRCLLMRLSKLHESKGSVLFSLRRNLSVSCVAICDRLRCQQSVDTVGTLGSST